MTIFICMRPNSNSSAHNRSNKFSDSSPVSEKDKWNISHSKLLSGSTTKLAKLKQGNTLSQSLLVLPPQRLSDKSSKGTEAGNEQKN